MLPIFLTRIHLPVSGMSPLIRFRNFSELFKDNFAYYNDHFFVICIYVLPGWSTLQLPKSKNDQCACLQHAVPLYAYFFTKVFMSI